MISKRLAALESKLVRPPDAAPVDMRPVIAGLMITIIAGHHGRKRKSESELTAFARAMRCSPVRLFELAHAEPKKFSKRLLALEPRADAAAVADAIVRGFICEEVTHQLVEACIAEAGLWMANMMATQPWPGLCRQRPVAGGVRSPLR